MLPITLREKLDALRMETLAAIKGKVRECVTLELESRVGFDQTYMGDYPDEERCIFALTYDEGEDRILANHENGEGFGEREEDLESTIMPDMTTDELVALYEECCRSLPDKEDSITIGNSLD